jgi:aryl-alcohol dehydrogenase-like predicted oxidoreductase
MRHPFDIGIMAMHILMTIAKKVTSWCPPPEPIGSTMIYGADIVRARRLMPLVKEGFAASLTEAATRFTLSHPAVGTIPVGMATPQQFQDALAAVQKDPLPPAALERLTALQ